MLVNSTLNSLAVTGTIWVALLLYIIGEYGRGHHPGVWWARPIWVLGSLFYVAHVTVAFALHHNWSHAVASAYTAAETKSLIGIDSGVGIWVNYAFTAIWIGEGLWARRWAPDANHGISRAVRGFFLFMIVNGAIVFVAEPQRWLGVAAVMALLAIWRTGR